MQAHAARIAARTQAHERDAIAVSRVHIGLDLEDEAGEFRLAGLHGALQGRARHRPANSPRNADSNSLTPKL